MVVYLHVFYLYDDHDDGDDGGGTTLHANDERGK
jgi:hypothetical protein